MTLWRWRWVILAAVAISLATGFLVTRSLSPVYRSTVTLMVGQFLESERPTAQDMMAGERLARTYAQLVSRQPVLSGVIEDLQLPFEWRSLVERVQAAPRAGTHLLEITVSDSDPKLAQTIAGEIATQLIGQSPAGATLEDDAHARFLKDQLVGLRTHVVTLQGEVNDLDAELAEATTSGRIQLLQNQIEPLRLKLGSLRKEYVELFRLSAVKDQTNHLSVVEPAYLPTRPSAPSLWLNVLLSGLGGALLSVVGVFLFDYLDDRYRDSTEIEEHLGLPVMVTIPSHDRPALEVDSVLGGTHSNGPSHEEFRLLHANLAFTRFSEHSNLILVTSSGAGEGKTTSVLNLGLAIASSGRPVLLVDGDLRRGTLSGRFGLSSSPGLSTLLADASLKTSDVIVPTSIDQLSMLPSGPMPPNPVELLGSELMKERFQELALLKGTVLVDSPPVLALADAPLLASLSRNVLFVIDSRSTRRRAALESKEALARADAFFLGVIHNGDESRQKSDYYYSSSHRSS